jgi:hypothetical protein
MSSSKKSAGFLLFSQTLLLCHLENEKKTFKRLSCISEVKLQNCLLKLKKKNKGKLSGK